MKFLWFLATSDTAVLEKVQDNTEKIWHSIIGTFVLITGIFAFITGSFTANLLINPVEGMAKSPSDWLIPLGAGLIWALLIITIDRLLIASIASERKNKYQAPSSSYDTEGETPHIHSGNSVSKGLKSFSFILLRLGIALLISLIITKPFELWLFQDQIDKEGISIAHDEIKKSQEGLISTSQLGYLDGELSKDSVKKEQLVLEMEKASKIEQYRKAKAKQLWRISANNKAISKIKSFKDARYFEVDSSKNPPKKVLNSKGKSRIEAYKKGNIQAKRDTARLRNELIAAGISLAEIETMKVDDIHSELELVNDEIASHESQRNQEFLTINKESDKNKATIERSINDLFGKLDSLERYIYNEEHPKRKYISWFILFIFLSIETLPILSKMLSSSGEYEQRIMARYSSAIQELQDQGSLREMNRTNLAKKVSDLQERINSLGNEALTVETMMEEFDRLRS